jgi:hypothetical protein
MEYSILQAEFLKISRGRIWHSQKDRALRGLIFVPTFFTRARPSLPCIA